MTDSIVDRHASIRPQGTRRLGAPALRVMLVTAVAFALGGLTSFGQLLLPAEFSSLANSASGWMIPTAALVYVAARSNGEAALGGALAFVALTVGYAVVSGLRGFSFDPSTWAVIGLIAGPVVGVAAHALRRSARSAAIGAGVLAGILVGEGVYGLTVVGDTTSPVYWWVVIALGAALVAAVAVRIRALTPAAGAAGGLVLVLLLITVTVAAAFVAAFLALPLVFAAL